MTPERSTSRNFDLFTGYLHLLFNFTKENQTLAQMNENYKLSDTFQNESVLNRSKFVMERDGEVTIVALGSSVIFGIS